MEPNSRRRFRSYCSPHLSRKGVVTHHRPWSWCRGLVAMLVGFMLVTWALPGSAPGATPEKGPRERGLRVAGFGRVSRVVQARRLRRDAFHPGGGDPCLRGTVAWWSPCPLFLRYDLNLWIGDPFEGATYLPR
jgi:hypothetical protein